MYKGFGFIILRIFFLHKSKNKIDIECLGHDIIHLYFSGIIWFFWKNMYWALFSKLAEEILEMNSSIYGFIFHSLFKFIKSKSWFICRMVYFSKKDADLNRLIYSSLKEPQFIFILILQRKLITRLNCSDELKTISKLWTIFINRGGSIEPLEPP